MSKELSFVDQLVQSIAVSQELLAESANAKKCIDALSAIETESELVKVTLAKLGKLSGNNKKGAVDALSFLVEQAQAVLEKEEADQAPVRRLAEIEEEILKHHSVAANALLTIGKLLNEAREEFAKAKEFLVWAEDKFGYKKAYVYRLMAAAEKFGDNPAFEGVAIKVLTIIAGLPEEVQKQAEELAEQGQLDTAKAQELQDKANPAADQETPVQAKVGPSVDTGWTGAPWEEQASEPEQFGEDPDFAPAPVSVVLSEVKAEAPTELSELNPSDLQALIRSLQEQLREAKAAAIKKPDLPWLPQFDNECLAARLGLSEAQGLDAKQARKAYRALVKVGYGVEHPANAKLQEALEHLLGQSKAA